MMLEWCGYICASILVKRKMPLSYEKMTLKQVFTAVDKLCGTSSVKKSAQKLSGDAERKTSIALSPQLPQSPVLLPQSSSSLPTISSSYATILRSSIRREDLPLERSGRLPSQLEISAFI
jgi:hypothetical protein